MQMPSSLTHKLGPLPVWAWGVVIGGAWLAFGLVKGKGSTTAATAGPFATAPADSGGTGSGSGILGASDTTVPITSDPGGGGGSYDTVASGVNPYYTGPADTGNTGTLATIAPTYTPTPVPLDVTNGSGAAGPSMALAPTVTKALSKPVASYVGAASVVAPTVAPRVTAGAATAPRLVAAASPATLKVPGATYAGSSPATGTILTKTASGLPNVVVSATGAKKIVNSTAKPEPVAVKLGPPAPAKVTQQLGPSAPAHKPGVIPPPPASHPVPAPVATRRQAI